MSTAEAMMAGWIFLPFVTPIAIWVAFSDMSTMKIPNKSVMALFLVFVILGLVLVAMGTFTLPQYGWRFVHLVVVLLIGFVANAAGLLGAGDAKFGAAMAPFIAPGDFSLFAYVLALSILIGFIGHRIAQRIPFIRSRTPDWVSWDRKKFPMGLCLGMAIVAYLALIAAYGS